MLNDLFTVTWKEIRELFFAPGNSVRGRMLLFIAIVGIILPFQQGTKWLDSSLSVQLMVMEPVFLVLFLIADSFAGERERHTLETLLASRLSDRSILFGKLITTIIFGWLLTLIMLLVGLIVVNLKVGGFVFYSGEVVVASLLLSLLVVTFMSALGILISLKAASVRQAQQTLSITFAVIFFALLYGVQALPHDWLTNLFGFMGNFGDYGIIFALAAVLLVVDLGLIGTVLSRFQRSRLILS